MPNQQSAIIIGGGMAGLTAAALLAKRGLAVTLLEKEDKIGGYVTGFWREGFYFDATGAFLAACKPGGEFHGIIHELDLEDKIKFLPIPSIKNIYPDFELHLDYRNPAAYVQGIKKRFAEHGEALDAYTELTAKLGNEFLSFEKSSWWHKLLMPFFFPTLFKWARHSHGIVLNHFFPNEPRIVHALSALPTTLPPSQLSYIFVAVLWAKVLKDGVFYPAGGMLNLSQQLADSIVENGGNILCQQEVTKINQQGSRVSSVQTADGKSIEADWVLGAINPYAGQNMLTGKTHLYGRMYRLSRFKVSSSALLFYVALPPDVLPADWPYFISLHTGNDPENEALVLEQGSMAEGLHLVITTPSVLDKSLAPDKHHTLKVLIHAPWASLFAKRYGSEETLSLLQERIFKQIKTATGLDIAKHALFTATATPMTLQRRTGNEEGAMYGFDAACGQAGPQRPPFRTRLDNLLWMGHYNRPAHGIVGSALSGSFAANIIKPLSE